MKNNKEYEEIIRILNERNLQYINDLLAKPNNKDHVSYPSSLASRLLLEFFKVPGPLHREKATKDDSQLASLGDSPFNPRAKYFFILECFLSLRNPQKI